MTAGMSEQYGLSVTSMLNPVQNQYHNQNQFPMRLPFLFTTMMWITSLCALAQGGNLTFNQVILLSNTDMTVPTGRVWKVTAMYGQETRVNECVDFSTTSTHEIGTRARCGAGPNLAATISARFNYSIRSLVVNGTAIPSAITGFSGCPGSNMNTTTTCSGGSSYDCTYYSNTNFSCVNMNTDPNLLPLWVPAGTTLRTGGPKTFASVIEFIVTP
jgi:hypothetical protein